MGILADPSPSDGAMPVALAWEAGPTSEALKATVQLQDSLGNTVGLDDRVLLEATVLGTDPALTRANLYAPKGHLGPAANATVARALRDALMARGLLPR